MKAIVVYESIFGNTRDIAEAIARGLRPVFQVEVVEVGHATPDVHADLLVLGGPTHAWGMTRPSTREDARKKAGERRKAAVSEGRGIREWLDAARLKTPSLPAATFDTAIRTLLSGSAARKAAAQLRRRGCQMMAPPEQFFVTDVDGPLEAGELERATHWGEHIARQFASPWRDAASPSPS